MVSNVSGSLISTDKSKYVAKFRLAFVYYDWFCSLAVFLFRVKICYHATVSSTDLVFGFHLNHPFLHEWQIFHDTCDS